MVTNSMHYFDNITEIWQFILLLNSNESNNNNMADVTNGYESQISFLQSNSFSYKLFHVQFSN